jgi:RHS repeat-associated protein
LTEVDGNNNWKHTNVYAGGKLIGTYDGNVSAPSLHFYVDDPLGTRRAQVSAAGALEATYQSLPFGDGLAQNPVTTTDDPTENHFTGKERDTESGNDYMFARYYNSATGRFLSPDWSAKHEPVPYAKLDNPQSLNLYAYVGNNPLSRTDPDGHYTCKGNKDQCAEFQTGLNLARASMDKLGANSTEGKAIGKVLSFYGSSTDKNSVNISFGTIAPNTLGRTNVGKDGSVNIKLDLKLINSYAPKDEYTPGTSLAVRAGTEIHEGTHGVDGRILGRDPENRHEELHTERNAWTNESYVYKGLGVGTPDHLSEPGNIEKGAQASTTAACAAARGCAP